MSIFSKYKNNQMKVFLIDYRFMVNIFSIEGLTAKSLMGRILVKDIQKEREAQIYNRFYKLGNHYMFHNFWDNINTFVLEQLDENK